MSHRRKRKDVKKEKNKNRTILVISDWCSSANRKYWREHKDD